MSKGLATLIRLKKRELDGLRQALASFYAQKEECERAIANLEEELRQEMNSAQQNMDISRFFGDFAGRIKRRREEIQAVILQIDAHIDRTREAMLDRFSELKKYEIAEAARIAEEKRATAERETRQLDEIGLTGFAKKQKDNG